MKDFFSFLPAVTYPLDDNVKKVVDITVTAIITQYKINSTTVIWKKEINDGDTPQILSAEVYSDPSHYWTIMYMNNVINPYTDWYMTQTQLDMYIKKKYGLDKYDKLRHLEWYNDSDETYHEMDDIETAEFMPELIKKQNGDSTHRFPHNARAVTNVYWETRKNAQRKFIQIISPHYINKFIELFDQTINRYES